MADKETVQFILSTYELSEDLRQRLERIATARLRERFIHQFDKQYQYIDYLVERFTHRKYEHNGISLDQPVFDGTYTAYHEIIPDARDDPFETESAEAAGASEEDQAMEILARTVNPVQYHFVEELLRDSCAGNCIRLSCVTKHREAIRARLDELARRYQVNGRIVFPRRPIRKIQFDPLRIRFGRRDLGDNPLKYFQQYRHVYRGLRRKELFEADQGLYQALRAQGQLHKAIRETYWRR